MEENEELKKYVIRRKIFEILVAIQLVIFAILIINIINILPCFRTFRYDCEGDKKTMPFNAKFEGYEGIQKGNNVKALIILIENHNKSSVDNPTLQISIVKGEANLNSAHTTAVGDLLIKTSDIKAGGLYKVTFSMDKESNRIIECGIQEYK